MIQSVQEHNKALHEEMKKANPRDHLLPLMKSTFDDRRVFVQNDAASVTEIQDSYPALARFSVVRLCMPYVRFISILINRAISAP